MAGTANGNREYFEAAIRDLAMAQPHYPGWAVRLLTHPVQGMDNYRQLIQIRRECHQGVLRVRSTAYAGRRDA